MTSRILPIITLLFTVTFIGGCGGGSQVAEGGIGGTGISTGSVTGYGSIIVNGVHFDTTGAVVMKDDDAPVTNINDADINTLVSIGMIVTVKGTINDDGISGKAESITYEDILEGPVLGNPDSGATSFIALGQTIRVSGSTIYDDGLNTINDIKDGQVVEISGFRDENGDIQAAYVAKKSDNYQPADEFEIKGTATVKNKYELTIGSLTVSTVIAGIDVTNFDGEFIEAKGIFDGIDTLTASEVEIENESFDIDNADRAELEGIAISGCVATSCDFVMSGLTVRVNSNTQYDAGLSALDITVGDKLEAEGTLQGGVLIAEEIELK